MQVWRLSWRMPISRKFSDQFLKAHSCLPASPHDQIQIVDDDLILSQSSHSGSKAQQLLSPTWNTLKEHRKKPKTAYLVEPKIHVSTLENSRKLQGGLLKGELAGGNLDRHSCELSIFPPLRHLGNISSRSSQSNMRFLISLLRYKPISVFSAV